MKSHLWYLARSIKLNVRFIKNQYHLNSLLSYKFFKIFDVKILFFVNSFKLRSLSYEQYNIDLYNS